MTKMAGLVEKYSLEKYKVARGGGNFVAVTGGICVFKDLQNGNTLALRLDELTERRVQEAIEINRQNLELLNRLKEGV